MPKHGSIKLLNYQGGETEKTLIFWPVPLEFGLDTIGWLCVGVCVVGVYRGPNSPSVSVSGKSSTLSVLLSAFIFFFFYFCCC